MHRIVKLLGILFILGMVSFIICDEKGIEVKLQDNHIVFNKIEKLDISGDDNIDEEAKIEPIVVYKNTEIIRLNTGFETPYQLRNSEGIDPEYLARLEREKMELEEQRKHQVYTGPSFISLNDKDTVSSIFSSSENDQSKITNNDTEESNQGIKQIGNVEGNPITVGSIVMYVGDYHSINLKKGVMISQKNSQTLTGDTIDVNIGSDYQEGNRIEDVNILEPTTVSVERYGREPHFFNLKLGKETIIPTVSVEKYKPNKKHILNLEYGKEIKHEFVLEEDLSTGSQQGDAGLSDSMLESLLANDEIDVNTLESENDEFLQKVFVETRDTDVMNLIVETYLNEYQFIKAKKFLESLPDIYKNDLKPSLNLRLAFNSFALSSKTTNETLTNLIQDYHANNRITEEDKAWYLGVLALMQQDYDRFFEIANGFTLERHKSFTVKLQGYKDQISKQMGMPGYYFDTLVALELFNQGLFQPAKVLALSSLQQNSNYILPYQVLAYANFLTNSRDTSIEYLKKLIDLDPNNDEKYRFLMGVAYYWNEKYEQSVIMLSLIKDEKLRLDSERYLISDYLILDQKNKLIASWNKLLGYENLVASDFYTYFYETFYHPYSEGGKYEIYAFDTELANKMLRVCNIRLSGEESVICTYGGIGKNIALGQFDGLEESLLKLVTDYPQGYLYHALGEYYIKQGDMEKAKLYLLKAASMAQKKSEITQIKSLLQSAI